MGDKVTVGGTFSVAGGTWQEIELDIEGKSVAEIATTLRENAPGISLCHQCASQCADPELQELHSVVINGREYNRNARTGQWEMFAPGERCAPFFDLSQLDEPVAELLASHGIGLDRKAVRSALGAFLNQALAEYADRHPDRSPSGARRWRSQ